MFSRPTTAEIVFTSERDPSRDPSSYWTLQRIRHLTDIGPKLMLPYLFDTEILVMKPTAVVVTGRVTTGDYPFCDRDSITLDTLVRRRGRRRPALDVLTASPADRSGHSGRWTTAKIVPP